jgi:hypothetical protein
LGYLSEWRFLGDEDGEMRECIMEMYWNWFYLKIWEEWVGSLILWSEERRSVFLFTY